MLCARILPYGAIFGADGRWAQAVADSVDSGAEGIEWFTGPEGWQRADLDDSVENFLTAVTGAVSVARPLRIGR